MRRIVEKSKVERLSNSCGAVCVSERRFLTFDSRSSLFGFALFFSERLRQPFFSRENHAPCMQSASSGLSVSQPVSQSVGSGVCTEQPRKSSGDLGTNTQSRFCRAGRETR